MLKKVLMFFVLLLFSLIVIGGITSTAIIEEDKETTGTTSEKTKELTKSLIQESEDARTYYYEKGRMPLETKTEVKSFKGTNTVFVTTHYSNGTKATVITTKAEIDLVSVSQKE